MVKSVKKIAKLLTTVTLIAVLMLAGVLNVATDHVTALPGDEWEIEWNKNFGGSIWDIFQSVAPALDGGYIAVGYSYSTDGDLDDLNKGNNDAIIVKYDKNGNVVWNKNYGGSDADTFDCVASTSDGGYIAVGESWSTDGDLTGLNKGQGDAIIVKYDKYGEIDWNKNFGGTDGDRFYSITQTLDGGYVAVGYSRSSTGDLPGLNKGYIDAVIVKYDEHGDIEWNKNFGGSDGDDFRSVSLSADGGYAAVGYSNSTDDDLFGLNKGYTDAIIVKYDEHGNVEWNKNFGGSSDETFESIGQTSDGGYIVSGRSHSTDGDLFDKGDARAIIVKYDEHGDIEWNKSFGGDSDNETFLSVTQILDGGYVAVGYSDSTDGDLAYTNKGEFDGIIAKYDKHGEMEWNKNFGGLGWDFLHFVASTPDGGYVTVGTSGSIGGDLAGLNKGEDDAVIVKYHDTSAPTGGDEGEGGTNVAPPNTGSTAVQVGGSIVGFIVVSTVAMLGRRYRRA